MTDKPFDPSLPVAARHGRPVRILTTDLKGPRPIAAAHATENEAEVMITHDSNGRFCPNGAPSFYDLHNPTEQLVYEVCILPDRYGGVGLLNSRLVLHNVRLAFEGDKLVAVELIGDE